MRIRQWIAVICGVALIPCASMAAAQAVGSSDATATDGLVKVKSKQFDNYYVLPGTDFRGYTKVMLDPAPVAFAPQWLRDMNPPNVGYVRRTTAEDAEQIANEARTGFGDVFARWFSSAGYEVVTAPGADVLRLSPRLTDVYINAPKGLTMNTPSRVFTVDAGEATLALDIRDSKSGALVARIVDHRIVGDTGNLHLRVTTTVSNRFNFGNLFDSWAQSSVRGLAELKSESPVALAAPTRKP